MFRAQTPSNDMKRLEEANVALSRFAGQAAHDIQEPLRLIAGYLDLLVAHAEGRLELDAPRITREARDAAHRAQELVASLLDFTRASKRDPARERDVPLAESVDAALDNLRLRLTETGARVTHDKLPIVHGDATQLSRVFQNLVENSLKYATSRAPVVRIAAREEPSAWIITVDDNGDGFPKEGRDRLFEPFSRLHGGGTPGAGLGLAMVRAIVERHGGRVRALDSPEGGARVEMRFPKEVAR